MIITGGREKGAGGGVNKKGGEKAIKEISGALLGKTSTKADSGKAGIRREKGRVDSAD